MAIHITQEDLKTNLLILHTFRRSTGDDLLADAAARLIVLYSTQLNEKSRGELLSVGLDVNTYAARFEL